MNSSQFANVVSARFGRFSKVANLVRGTAHQGKASWDNFCRDLAWDTNHRTYLVTIRCRRHPHPAGEDVTKSSEALESRIHGDIRDRKIRYYTHMFFYYKNIGQ